MWAEPTFISALCEAGLSAGHPLRLSGRIKGAAFGTGPPGQSSCAENGLTQTAFLCKVQFPPMPGCFMECSLLRIGNCEVYSSSV